MSCQLGRRDQGLSNEHLYVCLEEGDPLPMVGDAKVWRGAESAAESFMEPLPRGCIASPKAAERPHARMAGASVPLV